MLWAAAGTVAIILAFALGRAAARRGVRPLQDAPAQQIIENLKSLNALLRTLASSPDITRSLFELALRIRAIVPCDRVGLALLTEDREGYSTWTARMDLAGPSAHPKPELHFPRGSTLIDEVVTSREARIVDDVAELAPTYLDANVVRTAGFTSFVLLPLIYEGEALGTLNLVARRPAAFSQADLHTLRPVAETLAMAHGSRRLANALARNQTATELSELTFAFANDMSGAVQAIIGQCELLAKQSADPAFERELRGMLQQAKRLREILNNMQRMTREHVATSSRPQ
jgi:GAF domain-containing protein